MLNLKEPCKTQEPSIESIEFHNHYPYASSKLENSEEVIVCVQHQDIYTLPSKSHLLIEGKFTKSDDYTSIPRKLQLSNNFAAYLFDEVRYNLNGVEIDRVRNPGLSSTLNGVTSFSHKSSEIQNYGWCEPGESTPCVLGPSGEFSVCLPLSCLLGFAEDYKKIIINVKQELILVRSRRDENCFVSTEVGGGEGEQEKGKIHLTKLIWRLPYVFVADLERINLLKQLEMGKIVRMNFRSWELYEYPLLPSSQRHVWSLKTSSQVEKPMYVILSFQTNRKDNISKDSSVFDHCNVTNVKLYLNSKAYPYDDMNIQFSKRNYSLLYHMYSEYVKSYYADDRLSPFANRNIFGQKYPIIAIDCSKQPESIKTGAIDVRLEFDSSCNFPDQTTAHCLVINQKSIEYNPLTGIVHRKV